MMPHILSGETSFSIYGLAIGLAVPGLEILPWPANGRGGPFGTDRVGLEASRFEP